MTAKTSGMPDLSNIDSTKVVIGGVIVLAIMGVSHAISSGMLESQPAKLSTEQLAVNLVRVGAVTLTAPAPVVKPAPAPVPVVETAPVVETPATPVAETAPAPVEAAPAVEAAPVVEAAPIEVAPIEVAPIEVAPVAETAPVEVEVVPAPAAVEVEMVPVPVVKMDTAPAAPRPHPQPAWLLHMAPLSTPAAPHSK